jgi:hypothetical protein
MAPLSLCASSAKIALDSFNCSWRAPGSVSLFSDPDGRPKCSSSELLSRCSPVYSGALLTSATSVSSDIADGHQHRNRRDAAALTATWRCSRGISANRCIQVKTFDRIVADPQQWISITQGISLAKTLVDTNSICAQYRVSSNKLDYPQSTEAHIK